MVVNDERHVQIFASKFTA